jgi:hypothetical protein
MSKKLQISIISGIFGLLSIYGFNCAQQGMHGAGFSEESSVSGAGIDGGGGGLGGGGPPSGGTPFSEPAVDPSKNLPMALNNAEQTFKSMLNVTGQMSATNAQNNEFNIRVGQLADNSLLSSINGPLLLSATSLAGEVCNGLLNREKGLAAGQRMYLDAVNFAAGPQNTAAAYASTIQKLSRGFWGHDIPMEESAVLNAYYADFVANTVNTSAQTSNLYLSTCAAMLSSFDAITF